MSEHYRIAARAGGMADTTGKQKLDVNCGTVRTRGGQPVTQVIVHVNDGYIKFNKNMIPVIKDLVLESMAEGRSVALTCGDNRIEVDNPMMLIRKLIRLERN